MRLTLPVVMRLLGGDPALDQPVAHGEGEGEVAVAVGGGIAILGQGAPQMALELLPQVLNRQARVADGWRRRVARQFSRISPHSRKIGGSSP